MGQPAPSAQADRAIVQQLHSVSVLLSLYIRPTATTVMVKANSRIVPRDDGYFAFYPPSILVGGTYFGSFRKTIQGDTILVMTINSARPGLEVKRNSPIHTVEYRVT